MNILSGGVYKHFKGNMYRVLGVAKHTETGEELVVYEALYGNFQMFCRPLSMFTEMVEDPNSPGNKIPRFEFAGVFPND